MNDNAAATRTTSADITRPFAPFEGAADVFCAQVDPRWAAHPYWERDIDHMGCGLCSFTMAVNILTGARLTPVEVYDIRRSWGFPQLREGNGDICAMDAQSQFNDLLRGAFGVESEFLADKGLASFARVLDSGDAVIWFSSRDWGEPWIWSNGEKTESQYAQGHLVLAWKHEPGALVIKDPNGPCELGNNVRYTYSQFERLLVGVLDNRYVLRAV